MHLVLFLIFFQFVFRMWRAFFYISLYFFCSFQKVVYFYHSHIFLVHFVSVDTQNCGFNLNSMYYSVLYFLSFYFNFFICINNCYDVLPEKNLFMPFLNLLHSFRLKWKTKIFLFLFFFMKSNLSQKKFWIKMCCFKATHV